MTAQRRSTVCSRCDLSTVVLVERAFFILSFPVLPILDEYLPKPILRIMEHTHRDSIRTRVEPIQEARALLQCRGARGLQPLVRPE